MLERMVPRPKDSGHFFVRAAGGHRWAHEGEPLVSEAIREVLRFWFTYPGFVIGNVWYKAYSYFRYEAWTDSLRWRRPERPEPRCVSEGAGCSS